MSDWSWKLRLFLSADLVGSTAFKTATTTFKSASTTSTHHRPEWGATFKEFFREFPEAVEMAYAQLPPKAIDCAEHMRPWKFSGDEILFVVQLARHEEAASHLGAFKQAICDFPTAWTSKGIPLKLKATAWLAGFPVTNTEIDISSKGINTVDFIGPGIDLGFRLARFADDRKFILSADLALMLLDAIDQTEIESKNFHLFLHGRERLKGIIGNEPYPIVWLDNRNGELDLEEELLGIQRKLNHSKLKEYLRIFLEHTPRLMRPFIDGDSDSKYGKVPDELAKLRGEMMAEESGRGYVEGDQRDTAPSAGNAIDLADPELPQ